MANELSERAALHNAYGKQAFLVDLVSGGAFHQHSVHMCRGSSRSPAFYGDGCGTGGIAVKSFDMLFYISADVSTRVTREKRPQSLLLTASLHMCLLCLEEVSSGFSKQHGQA
eukprot:398150-Pelagomonas_calceolata.AAC.2